MSERILIAVRDDIFRAILNKETSFIVLSEKLSSIKKGDLLRLVSIDDYDAHGDKYKSPLDVTTKFVQKLYISKQLIVEVEFA